MAANNSIHIFLFLSLLAFAPLRTSSKKPEIGGLRPHFYEESCPKAESIVRSIVEKAVKKEARMAASLIRLLFHDCFVQGCDASILLNNDGNITSEKNSNPNRNSVRGFDVIQEIKEALEISCPKNVSCADIVALAARDSTVISGGPHWDVPLGRRDSRRANLKASNDNIPAPNSTFRTILNKFQAQGLDVVDLVALSGSHTVGVARCASIRQRLYNASTQAPLNSSYAEKLIKKCPFSGDDGQKFVLDIETPTAFDNSYFKNLLSTNGLLNSDQVLTTNEESMELVKMYAEDNKSFFKQFAKSMIKMGNIVNNMKDGEIRKDCRNINK